jgi:hypothetical protein
MHSKETLLFFPYALWPWKPIQYKEKKSLIGKGVSASIHHDRASVASNKTLKPWPKLVCYFLQMNLAKVEVCQDIIFTQILNMQSFPHWMVLSSMPVFIWSCTYVTIPRSLSIMEAESTLLTSDISDLVPLEPDNDNKVLSLLLLLLLLLLFPSLKLESSSPLLLLTTSSSKEEVHMVKLIPCWHSRTELHWQDDMMCWWCAKNIFSVLICYSEHYACIWEKLPKGTVDPVCEEALNQDKKS